MGPLDESALAKALAGDFNQQDKHGATALWHATYYGRLPWVERLLDAGARIDGHDAKKIDRAAGSGRVVSSWQGIPEPRYPSPTGGSTLLHVAVSRVVVAEIIELLLARGIPVDARDAFGCTPLHLAASGNEVAACTQLIAQRADPNAIDCAGYNSIDHGWSNPDVLAVLLQAGGDPNGGPHIPWGGSSYEWSPITHAAASDRVEVLDALLAAGATIARHPEALPLAAKHGHTRAVERLIAAGAPLDGTTHWRGRARTPLASAAMYASLPCCKLLLPRCKHELDFALLTAVELSSDDFPSPPNDRAPARRELVAWLLDAGANPTTAVIAAASVEDDRYLKLLLARGARVAEAGVDDYGDTPLFAAARRSRPGATQLLLTHGADPLAKNGNGQTAWQIADHEYRVSKVDAARLVMSALAAAGGAPAKPVIVPAAPSGPAVGASVTHPKFGAGKLLAIAGDKWTVRFAEGDKTLLAKFLTLV